MPTLTSDSLRTEERLRALDSYMADQVVGTDGFVCSDLATCRASHPSGFYPGQLHHVGRHYDLFLDGQPLRVAVVGQEYGHGPPSVLRTERSEMVVKATGQDKRFKAEPGYPARNPHMRGTTSLLRLLFGNGLGTDYVGELLDLQSDQVHIYEAFALTNFLLCSAVPQETLPDSEFTNERIKGAQRGKSTKVMRQNCARHFRETMRILEPTVIVAQGKGVREWIGLAADGFRRLDEALPLERIEIGDTSAILATFTHPSAPSRNNWGMNDRQPYLLDVVRPTVERMRDLVLNRDL